MTDKWLDGCNKRQNCRWVDEWNEQNEWMELITRLDGQIIKRMGGLLKLINWMDGQIDEWN